MADTPDLTRHSPRGYGPEELDVRVARSLPEGLGHPGDLDRDRILLRDIFKDHFPVLVLGLLCLGLVKAGMVGWYFMHLKFERKWVYLLIIPACILAVFLTLMPCPDMAMKPVTEEESAEEEAWIAPASETSVTPLIRLALADAVDGSCPGRFL